MKPKTKEFADKVLSDPKISNTQAYIDTHQTNDRNSAKANASKLLAKANVKIYMKKHEQMAKNKIVSLLSSKDETALKAAQDILDRNFGKSVQRQVSQNTNINLDIPASKELADNFEQFMKHSTVI